MWGLSNYERYNKGYVYIQVLGIKLSKNIYFPKTTNSLNITLNSSCFMLGV